MSTLRVHVGNAKDMGKRFVRAFKQTQAGKRFEERHITFLSLQDMLAAITPKRLELLRELHKHGADNVMALSRALSRDYKRVHSDVAALEAAGLVVRQDGRLTAPWETVSAEVAL